MINNKLKQIRAAFNYSQGQMAGILGVSRPTYAEIEKGTGEITLSSLEKLSEKIGVNIGSLVSSSINLTEQEDGQAIKKYKNMLLYILSCGADNDGKITKTKLAKLLYLVDFAWFYNYSEPMSGMKYRRLQYGPVPDQYFRVLEELVSDDQIKIAEKDAKMISAIETIPPSNLLSKKEISLIEKVCKKWQNKNTQEIVDFTHNQLPWQLCKENELIPYELIIQEDPEHVY